jgi:hypothetical protein
MPESGFTWIQSGFDDTRQVMAPGGFVDMKNDVLGFESSMTRESGDTTRTGGLPGVNG